MRAFQLILAAFSLVIFHLGNAAADTNIERKIQIVNDTGHKVEIFWVHPYTQEMVLQTQPHIYTGTTFDLNSFVGHSFQANELPGKKTGACAEESCKTAFFTVSENEDQVFYLGKGMELVEEDDRSIAEDAANDIMGSCREQALQILAEDPDSAVEGIERLVECAETNVAQLIQKSNEEVAFQANVREKMGDLLENYTCADFSLETTEPLETKKWRYKGTTYTSHAMHERKHSRIHMVEDFITEDECKAMEDAAKSKLHQATVADTDGGSRLATSRKAKQAGIKVPWSREFLGNHIATLSRKVFDYTNYATNYGLQEHGQEDLMFIQYEGRGEDDPEPDRYMPHCDGDCVGRPHREGTRVATMVMYCEVAEKGGATNFRNAGVHVIPKAGNAVFFSYMGSDGIMDKGFTEHSGCPVLEGGKKIVTQWMRKGVDTKNPWDSWNTMGVKYSNMND